MMSILSAMATVALLAAVLGLVNRGRTHEERCAGCPLRDAGSAESPCRRACSDAGRARRR